MALHGAASVEWAGHPVEPIRADVRIHPQHTLLIRQTSFIGRTVELAELGELLGTPNHRLLTIIGPGGIGKTRLALEVAEAAQESFADGVAFVQLQIVEEAESVAAAVAEAIGCPLTRQRDAREQVVQRLRPLQLLLVMDNFEHLLGAAAWLSELLAAAPGLCVLVTSREALNLREEWRYPLAGLAAPTEAADDPEQFEAVRLFVERSRQVRRDFSLEAERHGVVRLCRITQGLPLALELAAAWVRTLPCAAIADEIERNVAFLATDLRNVPVRHRSMQAAFDYSWALLTEDERSIFQRLAVFRGGFRREDAERVAGATLPLLSSLVDKSLVRFEAGGRFHLQELLRQYAGERLRAVPDEEARASAAHRDVYLGFVAGRLAAITGGAQREASAEIAAELDNIRSAWRAAAAAGDVAALGRSAHTLTVFCDFRARYREGLALLAEGLQVLRCAVPSPQVDRTLAAMLVDAARLNFRLGQLPAMRALLAESEERFAHLPDPPPPGQMTDPQWWRAFLALVDGQYAEADRLGAEVVRRNTAGDRPGNLPMAWWVRAGAALWQGNTDAAGEYARRSTEAALLVGDRWVLAYGRSLQGHVAIAREEYAEARRHYEEGYAILEEFDDREGMGSCLTHLANVAARQGDWPEAERLYGRGLTIAREIGDPFTIGNALNGLGRAACASGEYVAAGQIFAEGLRLMAETRYMRFLLAFLVSAADWLLQTGRAEEAVGTLVFAAGHAASDHETRPRARQLLAAAAAMLPTRVYEAAVKRRRDFDAAALATRLIPMLTEPLTVEPTPAVHNALIEPLTVRELEVLRLIAAGRSNREIADELFLAVNTVRSYSQQLYGKLGVGSRTQAVARARDIGLLD